MYGITFAFPYTLEVPGNDRVECWIARDTDGVATFYSYIRCTSGGAEAQIREAATLANGITRLSYPGYLANTGILAIRRNRRQGETVQARFVYGVFGENKISEIGRNASLGTTIRMK